MNNSLEFGLDVKTIEALKTVFANYSKIERVIIYGSRAKGTCKEGSDIDLTIVAPQLSLTDQLKIENEIDELMLPYKIDLSLFHLIDNPDVVKHINRVGKLFYQN